MIKERNFEGFRIYDIDSNGDNYQSFKMSIEYLSSKEIVNSNYSGGFDSERLNFQYLGITFELTYSGFFGTELKVSDSLSDSEFSKVRQLAEEIYNQILNNESWN